MTRWKTVTYEESVDGEVLVQIMFHKDSLELELHDPGFENGLSFVFFAPCELHDSEVCWHQWINIEEPDECRFDEDNSSEPFGWWMI
jgi:hypothetical protein